MADHLFPEISDALPEYVNREKATCHCGTDLSQGDVYGYEHDAGWDTARGCMWLYVRCPKCGYEMALWKMGVSRGEEGFKGMA